MDFTNLAEFMDYLTGWRIPGNSCVVYKDRNPVFQYFQNRFHSQKNDYFPVEKCLFFWLSKSVEGNTHPKT